MSLIKIFFHLLVTILIQIHFPNHAFSNGMEDPLFWINKIQNPNLLLLTPSEINILNETSLKRQELQLYNMKEMKEEWSREEIRSFLIEDWKNFGNSRQPQYGRHGTPLKDSFWSLINEKIHHDGLKEKNRLLFGMTVKRTDIRVFPTDEPSMPTPASADMDLFQHSAIAPASPVGIYYFSRDTHWAYVQTPFIRGWIRMRDLAIGKDKNQLFDRSETKEPLVVTGSFVNVFDDSQCTQPAFSAQMGTVFQKLRDPGLVQIANPCYTVRLPFKEADGHLIFRNGYIPVHADTHLDYLPYTQKNLALQAFKMLHEPYSWGEKTGGRDCSRFIMDIFNSFGILMPRNSNLQAKMGVSLGPLEGKTMEEKKKILDKAPPLATLLRMPGHIMLYLGKHEGKHYAIHGIWGIQTGGQSGSKYQKIGKVVVTDLDLGKEGPNGSLLNRLTEIQLIVSHSKINK